MPDRKTAPPIIDSTEFKLKLPPYTLFHLDNGVPVYAVDAGAQDVLQVEMVFYAGNSFHQSKRGVFTREILTTPAPSVFRQGQAQKKSDYIGCRPFFLLSAAA